MRVLLGLLFLAVAVAASNRRNLLHQEPPPPPVTDGWSLRSGWSRRLVESKTITQKQDHFDASNTATWEMRYYSNNEHYVPGGPLFIYVGGEWAISYGWVTGGHMYDMAKEMNGYVFYTEHRYYGQSFPTSDASTDNLKYLDVDQALADLAAFIDYQRATLPGASNAGVILVGASYSATMVAWFRQRYPEKANGVWASSAPLNAQVDFLEYKEVVSWAIEKVGPVGCSARIQAAFAQMELEIESGNVAGLKEKFNLCADVDADNILDVWNFFAIITDEFAGLVQYHMSGDIENACATIMDSTITDPVEAVGKWVQSQFRDCVDAGYQSFIDYYSDPSWTSGSTTSAYRQWIYQTCNEFGWYQSSTSNNQIFGSKFPVQLNVDQCGDLFSSQFTSVSIQSAVDETNRNHNGFSPEVTNVFFTHGELDPWREMGVQTDVNESAPVVILEGHSHCADLYSISASDTEQMRNTKLQVTAAVRNWLGMS